MLPFGDDRLGAAPDSDICFAVVELDEAGKVAFEAKPKGSLGHLRGEPVWCLKAFLALCPIISVEIYLDVRTSPGPDL